MYPVSFPCGLLHDILNSAVQVTIDITLFGLPLKVWFVVQGWPTETALTIEFANWLTESNI